MRHYKILSISKQIPILMNISAMFLKGKKYTSAQNGGVDLFLITLSDIFGLQSREFESSILQKCQLKILMPCIYPTSTMQIYNIILRIL